MADLVYNGTQLFWVPVGLWKATSGMPGSQNSLHQFERDKGPIPEGTYVVPLRIGGNATITRAKYSTTGEMTEGTLDTRSEIQSLQCITDPKHPGNVMIFANWGSNRVRLAKQKVKYERASHRDGFYLHDSTKGFSHGCIEVETAFFASLRDFATKNPKKKSIILKVDYGPSSLKNPGVSTFGQTDSGVPVAVSCPAP